MEKFQIVNNFSVIDHRQKHLELNWLIHCLSNTSQTISQTVHYNNGVELEMSTHVHYLFLKREAVVHNLFVNVTPEA